MARATTHYSKNLTPKELMRSVAIGAKKILEWAKKNDKEPVLVYTGMSGIGVATGISLWLARYHPDFRFYMAYVRKENEKSHGTEIENDIPSRGYGVTDKMVGVFVDDFVDSGETFKRCKHKVNTLGLDIVATYVTKMNVFNPRPNEKGK